MLKKMVSALRHLSLTKQLFLIFGGIALGIFVFVVPYIENNIQHIVDKQLYQSITGQQEQLIAFIEGGVDSGYEFADKYPNDNNLNVSHLLYDLQENNYQPYFYYEGELSSDLNQLHYYIFYPAISLMVKQHLTTAQFSQSLSNQNEIYFVITQSQFDDSKYYISFAYNDISTDLLAGIRSELVNVLYGVIIFIALILALWIYTMIKPLRQIQNYIRAIKQSKKFNLSLKRHDEIGEVGEALKEMEAELDRQNQLQSDLIHNISHDLKTPIAIIRSYSECMKDDIYPYGDKNSSLDVIIENADRLEKKVKDFLYLNRLDYLEENTVCKERVNVGEIAKHLVDELAPLNDRIQFEIDISDAYYIGEYDHWFSVLMNILDNALRYANKMIKVIVNEQQIVIYNDGSHIDEQLKNEIFEPYTKGPKGNFGLGMSIVYKIVKMYHCDINVDNVDDGVAFTISPQT